MLAKVLKNDIKATARLVIPAYLIFIAISIINKLSLEISLANNFESTSIQLTQGFTFMLYVLTVFVIGILTTVFVVMHFYETMAGKQGYLTHTLPAQTEALIISKILCSMLWQLVVWILISSSIFFMCFGHVREISTMLSETFGFTWRNLIDMLEFDVNIYSILLVTTSIVNAILAPVTFLACIALGNLSSKHKVMSGVFSFVGLYMIFKILRLIINIGYEVTKIGMVSSAAAEMVNGKMLFDIIVNLVIATVLYLLTVHIFKKRLNLE